MATWFKTVNNIYCNKICQYITQGLAETETLNHLLEFELKGKIPSSLIVENPSKEFIQQIPQFRGKSYFSFWDIGLAYKNYKFLNWLMTQPSFELSEVNAHQFIDFHLVKIKEQKCSPELKEFILQFISFYTKKFSKFVNHQDKVPTSLIYHMAPSLPEELAKELLSSNPPDGFSDLRLLPEDLYQTVWQKYKGAFPLLSNIETYEKKKITFKYSNNIPDNNSSVFEAINLLVSNPKLSASLKNLLGLESRQTLKAFDKNFFIRKKTVVELDFKFFTKSLWLSQIFNPQDNAFDFISLLNEDLKGLKNIYLNKNLGSYLANLLNNFNYQQKKDLLSNLQSSYQDLNYALETYNRYTSFYQNCFKKTDFKQIHEMNLLRDFILDHEEVSSVPLENLMQENYYPEIKQVCDLTFPGDYKIKVAQTNHELINWGIEMGHCIGGEDYQIDAQEGECLLVALCLNDKPKYAVEIRDNRVIQIQGKSSSRPDRLLNVSLYKALEHFNLIRR
jgi:hypothetical protein